MRIAMLGPSRHPVAEPFAGGQESHVATLTRALRRRGHHVTLYAAPGSDDTIADALWTHPPLPLLSAVAALDPQLPEPGFLYDHHAFFAVLADLLRRRGTFDVIHNNSLHHLPLVASSALTAPVLTTLHTPPFPWMEVGTALADRGARFVAVSRDLAAQWTTLDPPPSVVLNGVDPERFPFGPGGSSLVWVGRLVPDKGADVAIAAARRAGHCLKLIGPISDPEWFRSIVQPVLDDNIRYVGHLDQADCARIVGASSALLVTPRWEEPFGLVAAEAALTGTPVVAIRRGGLAEVVRSPIGILVTPRTTDTATCDGLVAAITSATALSREEVSRSARQRFGAETMARAYEEIYSTLPPPTPVEVADSVVPSLW
ncbi:MAG: glycosyltransferase [Ornithinimicrobium sp.]